MQWDHSNGQRYMCSCDWGHDVVKYFAGIGSDSFRHLQYRIKDNHNPSSTHTLSQIKSVCLSGQGHFSMVTALSVHSTYGSAPLLPLESRDTLADLSWSS